MAACTGLIPGAVAARRSSGRNSTSRHTTPQPTHANRPLPTARRRGATLLSHRIASTQRHCQAHGPSAGGYGRPHIPSNRGAPRGKRLEPSATAAQAETIMVREGDKIKRQRTGTPLAAARAIAARTAIQLPIPASAGGDEPQGGGQHNRYFFNTLSCAEKG